MSDYFSPRIGPFCPVVGHPTLDGDGHCAECDILADRGTPIPGYVEFLASQAEQRRTGEAYGRAMLGTMPRVAVEAIGRAHRCLSCGAATHDGACPVDSGGGGS